MINALQIPHDTLFEQRKQRLADFYAVGLPHKKQEAWKYTDLKFLANTNWQLAANSHPASDLGASDSSELINLPKDAIKVVLLNGALQTEQAKQFVNDGLTVLPISEAIANGKLSRQVAKQSLEPLVNLNSALMQNGIYLHLANNRQLTQPIYLIYINSGAKDHTCQLRQIIELAENSSATILELHIDLDSEQRWVNKVSMLELGEQAHLQFYKLQQHQLASIHTDTIDVSLHAASQLEQLSISTGAKLARDTVTVRLQAEHATATLNGAYLLHDQQHIDHHTSVQHLASYTRCAENYKGIIADNGTAVFNGQILVSADVKKIVAHLSNKNLVLSKQATVNTKPELQIYADDVVCSHGVTIGQLDRQALFYLRSRGIAESTAVKLLTQAFIGDVLNIIPHAEIKRYFTQQLLNKLRGCLGITQQRCQAVG